MLLVQLGGGARAGAVGGGRGVGPPASRPLPEGRLRRDGEAGGRPSGDAVRTPQDSSAPCLPARGPRLRHRPKLRGAAG